MKLGLPLAALALAAVVAGVASASPLSALAISDPGLKGSKSLSVSSPKIAAGGAIPLVYSSYGQGLSPPLAWSKGPPGTRSFALILEDPDAPMATPFVHWLVWNLPAGTTALQENEVPPGAAQGKLLIPKTGYMGPRPPPGPAHHYHVEVFAVDRLLDLAAGADRTALEGAMKGHVLASGELVATFQKP